MLDYIYCPFCEEDFEPPNDWSGQCPMCGETWQIEEYFTEDYSDSWLEPVWLSRGY